MIQRFDIEERFSLPDFFVNFFDYSPRENLFRNKRKLFEGVIQAYTQGNCWELALVLNSLYGYEIFVFFRQRYDVFEDRWHVVCKLADDLFFDVKGIYNLRQLENEYDYCEIIQPISARDLAQQINEMSLYLDQPFYVGYLTLEVAERINFFVESYNGNRS